ncbi:type IV secretory system conjugative DNA transfer family protein [Nitrosophilus labii]|uniref:type IV secretory system conjugative DNA transfer family protein n=1 Tax=Nitrosophilus labii TaxID=2706014 RepID=UPI001656C62C|nr:TraM recognition domain-containing protein [Nitrosophilus labii]
MKLFSGCCKKFGKNNHKNYTLIGKGFRIDDFKQKELVEIKLNDSNKVNHISVFGAPGVGKTRLLENMAEQDIIKGDNVIVVDPKGDIDLFCKIFQVAQTYGREKELLFLSPIFPSLSIHINPLRHYYMEEEIISHIVAGVPTEDEFFYNVSLETTTAIVKSLLMMRKVAGENRPLNFDEVARYAHYQGLNSLLTQIKGIRGMEEKDRIQELINQILSSPQDYFSKVSSTLRTTLTQMTTGNTGKIIGNVNKNIFIDRLERGEGVILYIQTGSLLTRQVSSVVSKVVISMIQSSVGRYYASGKKFDRRLNIYIDEMASSVYRGIETLYAQGRGANVSITGITQSMADIVAEIGRDRANRLFDLTSTKIVMRLNEQNSAELIARYGGTRKGYSPILSLNGGITTREVEEVNIKPEDVNRLQKREFYYFGFEGEYKGKTAPVRKAEYVIQFPDITSKEG